MKNTKKTEAITFRTSAETKEILTIMAEQRDWTISQLVERTVSRMAENEKKIWANEPDIEEPIEEEEEPIEDEIDEDEIDEDEFNAIQ